MNGHAQIPPISVVSGCDALNTYLREMVAHPSASLVATDLQVRLNCLDSNGGRAVVRRSYGVDCDEVLPPPVLDRGVLEKLSSYSLGPFGAGNEVVMMLDKHARFVINHAAQILM
jgi:hypothetical protein